MRRFANPALSMLLACGAAQAHPGLCGAPAERSVFACQAGAKLIAVCSVGNSAGSRARLEYRYGTTRRVELRIPEPAASGAAGDPGLGLITLSGGGGTTLRFRNGEFAYTVYSATSASIGDKSGVAVTHRGKPVGHVSCTGDGPDPDLDYEALSKSGLPADNEPFELP